MPTPQPRFPPGPRVDVSPAVGLLDQPISIRISGLRPGSLVVVTAAVVGDDRWSAKAVFRADAGGVVALARDPALRGDYTGADPMGLFWSLSPHGAPAAPLPASRLSPITVALSARAPDTGAATVAAVTRLPVDPSVVRIPVREGSVVGACFLPEGSVPRPGVLVLGGSGGRVPEATAALLASHGFPALALAYFGVPPLPRSLVEVPVEIVHDAAGWLRSRASVAWPLGVVGTSKGAELALLAAATCPEIGAVVGYVPSGVVFMGFGDDADDLAARSSWSVRGRPFDFVRWRVSLAEWKASRPADGPLPLAPLYAEALRDSAAVERASIPVERIDGDVLLISGGDDQLWPSSELAERIVERRRRHHRRSQHLWYPAAGHLIRPPYQPTTVRHLPSPQVGAELAVGGTPRDDALAGARSWPQVLGFLAEALRG